MAKRPRFEQMNYPEEPNGNNYWITVVVVAVVALGALYVGTHYWYGCDDWGVVKFCSMVKK
jgi:hypothetical protein